MTAAGFGGFNVPAEEARVVLLPVPYEKTTTYRRGTARGPDALLAASEQIELYDEEMDLEPLAMGVATVAPVAEDGMPDALADRLEPLVAQHLAAERIPGCLGGEHSISLGPLRAAARAHPGLGVLQVDAHPDLRDEYEGTRFGHGCVMRRALEEDGIASVAQVGLRSVSEDDRDFIRSEPRVHPFYAHRIGRGDRIEDVIAALPEKIYITFDVDGFDPSVVPGTGTPEPGGLGWWDAMALLRAVIATRTVVGFDVVELLPEPPSHVSDFAAARLVMKILAYLAARR